jgi:hypothetical protein
MEQSVMSKQKTDFATLQLQLPPKQNCHSESLPCRMSSSVGKCFSDFLRFTVHIL